MIDAHVHFWKYNKIRDAWITDKMQILQQDFLPANLEPLAVANHVDGFIAVQADQSETETGFLTELAQKNSIIKGVVGWVDLQNKNVEARLSHYAQISIIKGFRHIVQSEAEGFLREKSFLNGIKTLKKFGFTYDILIYETQLKEAIDFVRQFPEQKFIIDHCAKPSIINGRISEWKNHMREISKHENIFCKISGLITEANWNTWHENDFYPYLDTVFEFFGTERLLFGSDWPVMLLSGNYQKWKSLIEKYMKQFPGEERQKVFHDNAVKFYNLKLQPH